ncbi:hypothetical protein EUGRSUZ_C01470 [Eucalyptus grandis]|uniref:Uncharacterized protein n=2 Tax=Eucalyptus grandis TaxID=71139 RepID=A0ACC3LCM9_EUCGR|nr:hypothetical protein EUGRSUZ_C01470 [Eucalyptus grandis]
MRSCTLATRAHVPSGTAMLRSVGTSAFPLAGTSRLSRADFNPQTEKPTFRNHRDFSTWAELEPLRRKVKFGVTFFHLRRS